MYASIVKAQEKSEKSILLRKSNKAPLGIVHLWIDEEPPEPTDLYVLIFANDPLDANAGVAMTSAHRTIFDPKMSAIFTKAKVQLSDYGNNKRRTFHADIKVPQVLIDGYANP